MSQIPNPFNPNSYNPYQSQGAPLDYGTGRSEAQALSTFFNAVYAWMCAGLALTATVAWYVSEHMGIFGQIGGVGIIVLFAAQLGLVWAISGATQRISAGVATALFMLYAALNGVTLSVIFLVYTHAAIGGAFAITAAMFGAMSLYGYFTRKDLSSMGSLLFMALIGLVIASVVGMFWHNSALQVLINYAAVLIFTGLTAYDTQRMKVWAIQTAGDSALAARLSVSGALSLYLDFLNLFLYILRIMGDRR